MVGGDLCLKYFHLSFLQISYLLQQNYVEVLLYWGFFALHNTQAKQTVAPILLADASTQQILSHI